MNFKDTVETQALSSMQGGSLEIALTVPLSDSNAFDDIFLCCSVKDCTTIHMFSVRFCHRFRSGFWREDTFIT